MVAYPHTWRLGRKEHDPDRVAQVPLHMGAEAPPPEVLWRDIHWTPTLCKNNVLPTCTIAGLMNDLRMQYLTQHGMDIAWQDQSLLNLFAAVAGCDPTDEAIEKTDGLVMQDVLEYVTKHGFDTGMGVYTLASYTRVNTDVESLKEVIFSKGSAYTGVVLYSEDLSVKLSWQWPPRGSVAGGHCALPWRYNANQWEIATWGCEADASQFWLADRIKECWALTWTK